MNVHIPEKIPHITGMFWQCEEIMMKDQAMMDQDVQEQ